MSRLSFLAANARDLADVYLRFHVLIEFELFFLLFTAIVWSSLRHRLSGPPGKAVAVCAGVALSLALTLTMGRRDLSLLDLGWLPAVMLLLILAVVVVSAVRNARIGLPTLMAGVVLLFGMVRIAGWEQLPSLRSANIDALLGWLMVFLVLRLVLSLKLPVPSQAHTDVVSPAARRVTATMPAAQIATAAAIDRTAWLGRTLDRARGLLARGPSTPDGRRQIADALDRMEQQETQLIAQLTRIDTLARRLEWSDSGAYVRLRRSLAGADDEARPAIGRQLVFEWAKIEEEDHVRRIAREAVHQARRAKHDLAKARRCIRSDKADRAQKWMAVAGERQRRLQTLLGDLAQWERRLEDLARRQTAGPRSSP
jgi:hypothetical protein